MVEIQTIANENSSCRLSFQLTDFDGTGVAVTTATMTLKDYASGDIINERENIDVSSYFDDSGNFEMTFSGDDNPIIDSASNPKYELHLAIFTITVVSGEVTYDFSESVMIKVENLKYVG